MKYDGVGCPVAGETEGTFGISTQVRGGRKGMFVFGSKFVVDDGREQVQNGLCRDLCAVDRGRVVAVVSWTVVVVCGPLTVVVGVPDGTVSCRTTLYAAEVVRPNRVMMLTAISLSQIQLCLS